MNRSALSVLLICSLVPSGCSKESAKQGPPQQAVAVTVASPVVIPIVEWDEYTGRLDAIDSVEIRSRVSGYLAIVDPRPIEAELSAANARQAEAIARLPSRRPS